MTRVCWFRLAFVVTAALQAATCARPTVTPTPPKWGPMSKARTEAILGCYELQWTPDSAPPHLTRAFLSPRSFFDRTGRLVDTVVPGWHQVQHCHNEPDFICGSDVVWYEVDENHFAFDAPSYWALLAPTADGFDGPAYSRYSRLATPTWLLHARRAPCS